MQILLATTNNGKVRELKEMLGEGFEIFCLKDFPQITPAAEDGTTFAENALKKATHAAQFAQMWTLADDSGLAVDILDGAPGIYSARFAGEDSNDNANNAKLLHLLQDVPQEKRTARFISAVAVVSPSGETKIFEGTCEGRILFKAEGSEGFGYDPLFYSDDLQKSFGTASFAEKNAVSHRSRAMEQACAYLKTKINFK